MAKKGISVITVCLNSEEFIEQAILSFISQDLLDKELIIIDGGSIDETLKKIQRYSHLSEITVVSETDSGIYDAMNKGWALASRELIGFLNSDDFFYSTTVLSEMYHDYVCSGADVISGTTLMVDRARTGKTVRIWTPARRFGRLQVFLGQCLPHPSTYVRREIFERFNGFSRDFPVAADYEFFVRLAGSSDITFKTHSRCVVKMRVGGVSTRGLRSVIKNIKETWRARKINNFSNFLALPLVINLIIKVRQGIQGMVR